MKTLRNKLKNSNDLNGLERLLYADQPKQILPEPISITSKGYERGMMISISNNRTHYEEIIKRYKEQYLTLLYCLTGENRHTKYEVKSMTGIPDQETLIKLIHKKIPVMVCGIHDYRQQETLYGGSLQGWEYQHQHLFVYGIHHHLDSAGRKEEKIQKLFNPKYTNNKKRIKDAVRLTEVGVGTHTYTDPITATNLHEYLTNPMPNTLIHYISHNRHKPEVQYPLKTIYLSPNKNAI